VQYAVTQQDNNIQVSNVLAVMAPGIASSSGVSDSIASGDSSPAT